MTTKISVSLPEEDLAELDAYIQRMELPGRSAGVQAAIHSLRMRALADDYAAAFTDLWEDADVWDSTAVDGLE